MEGVIFFVERSPRSTPRQAFTDTINTDQHTQQLQHDERRAPSAELRVAHLDPQTAAAAATPITLQGVRMPIESDWSNTSSSSSCPQPKAT